MKFKTQAGQVVERDVQEMRSTFLHGSNDSESVLSKFNASEVTDLTQWAAKQDATVEVVNLAQWPGWNKVGRRIQADMNASQLIATALIARLTKHHDL